MFLLQTSLTFKIYLANPLAALTSKQQPRSSVRLSATEPPTPCLLRLSTATNASSQLTLCPITPTAFPLQNKQLQLVYFKGRIQTTQLSHCGLASLPDCCQVLQDSERLTLQTLDPSPVPTPTRGQVPAAVTAV